MQELLPGVYVCSEGMFCVWSEEVLEDGRGEMMSDFRKELKSVINRHCIENGSNTPDFILADYLIGCLESYDHAVKCRDKWYEVELAPAQDRSHTTKEVAVAILRDIEENVHAKIDSLGEAP